MRWVRREVRTRRRALLRCSCSPRVLQGTATTPALEATRRSAPCASRSAIVLAERTEVPARRNEMRVVICGGGVIGACTAYFLARCGVDVTVVERTGIACAASGKAGGFLALDWCAGGPLDPLARRSFTLHAELAG